MTDTVAAAVVTAYEDFNVGDRVWCLAWIGTPFEITGKDDERRSITIETPAGWPTYGQIDLHDETMFMLTHEQWDQIWFWPDRAGDRYSDVFERFVAAQRKGDLVAGHVCGTGLFAAKRQMTVALDPDEAMMFRVEAIDHEWGTIHVRPAAHVLPDGTLCSSPTPDPHGPWQPIGPAVPLRLEMRLYRWCLSFGEFVLNAEDLRAADLVPDD